MHDFQSVPALRLYNKLFNYLPPIVIKWSELNEQFELTGNTYSDNWIWYFNTFIVSAVIGFGSCIDVITHIEEAGSSLFVMSCGYASLVFLSCSSAVVMIQNKHEIVTGIKYLKNVFETLRKFCINPYGYI